MTWLVRRRDLVWILASASRLRAAQPMRIQWREGPEYPLGIQDSALAMLGGRLVSAGGFTRWPKDSAARYPGIFGLGKSGFTNAAFLFDPANPGPGWSRINDIPGPRRQAATAAVVEDALYAIGGFNYDAPYSYRCVYRLIKADSAWRWEEVPAPLPWPVCEAGVGVSGRTIYLVCGADFCPQAGYTDCDFNVIGRQGEPVGSSILALDTANLRSGWRQVTRIPGTPRFDTCAAVAAGKIYVFSGVHREPSPKPGGYANVVDAWCYDVPAGRWERLADLPHRSNQHAVTYKDRYILLVGGYRYGVTRRMDGSVENIYTAEEKKRDWKQFFESTVMVYDTKTRQMAGTDPLLDTTSYPMVAIGGDTAYVLGGEGGKRLWHPATFHIGRIQV
ncbi:MAG: hypothetical protein ABFD86_15075 [Bryobacteraceae bacterium]